MYIRAVADCVLVRETQLMDLLCYSEIRHELPFGVKLRPPGSKYLHPSCLRSDAHWMKHRQVHCLCLAIYQNDITSFCLGSCYHSNLCNTQPDIITTYLTYWSMNHSHDDCGGNLLILLRGASFLSIHKHRGLNKPVCSCAQQCTELWSYTLTQTWVNVQAAVMPAL